MRILLTNDDGINAPGLQLGADIAREIAGEDGEVWIIAPDQERSGVGHCISYTNPFMLSALAPRRYSVAGYPADCVLVGLHHLMRDTPPDLILSGVNRGHNIAEDVVYSGTIGAAMEGGINRVPSIALSQFFREPDPANPDAIWDSARQHGVAAVRAVLKMPFPDAVFYNVNFPACPADAVKGMCVCPQGLRETCTFSTEQYNAPNGRDYMFMRHSAANMSTQEGTDARKLGDFWITITPLRPVLTAQDLIAPASAALG